MDETAKELRALRPDRVCLIKPSSLGDVVNALPVVAALRSVWPSARISWVVNRGLRGLLDGHPDLDEVIAFDRGSARFSPRGFVVLVDFLRELGRRRFDLTIDLQGLFRSGLMSAATRAPVRVGLADAREGASRFYTHRIDAPLEASHAVDRLLKVAEAFGAAPADPRFAIVVPDADRTWAREILSKIPRLRLVVNLGARWPTKRWPPEKFAEIARRASQRSGAGLVAVGAGEDRPFVDAFARNLEGQTFLDLCGRTTLTQLAAVAGEADVFVSNDTGPLHIAAAVGTRVVGIYTCTRPEWNGPYGPKAVAVRTNVWCGGSYVKSCSRLDCMTELDVDRVWHAVQTQIERCEELSPSAA
jgi:lipopolysaccharide heptosyltransferase I